MGFPQVLFVEGPPDGRGFTTFRGLHVLLLSAQQDSAGMSVRSPTEVTSQLDALKAQLGK